MTAVIGILNTNAVAIAADSAVTVTGTGGQKIYNNGNKLFQLSKRHPIGIAVYGSGSLMITPWEIIIKDYRKQLGENSFSTVIDYRNDFLNYLRHRKYYTTGFGTSSFLNNSLNTLINILGGKVESFINTTFPRVSADKMTPNQRTQTILFIKNKLKEIISFFETFQNNEGNLVNWSQDELIEKVEMHFNVDDAVQQHPLGSVGLVDQEIKDLIKKWLFTYLIKDLFEWSEYSQYFITNFTGLIFVGYGNDEIYPHSHCIELGEVLDTHIRWRQHSDSLITEDMRADVVPFAQTDVIQTLLNGAAPKFENELFAIINNLLNQFKKDVSTIINPSNPTLARQLKSIDTGPLLSQLSSSLDAVKSRFFINPTLQAVELFSKEDLAEMAESLIFLTYLQKRMTFDQETVSKPVDVAVISKNDGFVWIKRKYYFDPALNPHFLRNYFNNQ